VVTQPAGLRLAAFWVTGARSVAAQQKAPGASLVVTQPAGLRPAAFWVTGARSVAAQQKAPGASLVAVEVAVAAVAAVDPRVSAEFLGLSRRDSPAMIPPASRPRRSE
jgi:hypothetical protein